MVSEAAGLGRKLPFPTHLCHLQKPLGNLGLMRVCYEPLHGLDAHVSPTPRGYCQTAADGYLFYVEWRCGR